MDRISGYASGLAEIARAEGSLDVVRGELAEVARGVDNNDELRASLSNNLLPATVRAQIVDDILGGKVSDVTRGIVGMIVATGHGGELGQIAAAFAQQAASGAGKKLAMVRTAVPLTAEQETRLAEALATRTGSPVDLQVEIDPTVMGGVITSVDDDVIDGSVRTRLNKLRNAL